MPQVQPPLNFLAPDFQPWVLRLAQLGLPILRRSQFDLSQIEAENLDRLVRLYDRFQKGEIRLMLAFRHPNPKDPICLAHLVWKLLPQAARAQNVALRSPSHFHFIYDRGIPLWAGSVVEWLFPKLGGTPIQRGKLDLMGLRSARNLFANGEFPLAAAPEGGTNGHNEIVSPLEPGIAQMAFWCVEDLRDAGRSEEVVILPLGIRYSYLNAPWTQVDALLDRLEAQMQLEPLAKSNAKGDRYDRLYRLGGQLLVVMERFYRDSYHRPFPKEIHFPESNEELAVRVQTLLDEALNVAEEYFGIKPRGTVIDRCRRLEQAGWNRIYRQEFEKPDRISPLERGLADRVAEEASLRMWHMRLVEHFVAVSGSYVRENPSVDRFADTAILMWKTFEQIQGDTQPSPHLGAQNVCLTVG
ncbi:MAG: 1-acyl-sn-glycerol-3-phosphate acyltransferase, partial [Cyanobacteriota bacterium]|nr:1-acyl-sn-glycerol-3-phosphate acyltransferase [Cyanobacteriota bacterium]